MSRFQAKPFDALNINGGNRYQNGDVVDAEAINAPIEAAAFVQSLALSPPDISEIDGTGTPSVEIRGIDTNEPYFKFKNLKGRPGVSDAQLSNDTNAVPSDLNGYTQEAIASMVQRNQFNLGEYDTINNNGDGTSTITRQTGYGCIDGINTKITGYSSEAPSEILYTVSSFRQKVIPVEHNNYKGHIVSNKFKTTSINDLYLYAKDGISIDDAGTIGIASIDLGYKAGIDNVQQVERANIYFSANPVYFQYKLPNSYEETVLNSVSMSGLDQKGHQWLSDEFEKGRNLFNTTELPETITQVKSYILNKLTGEHKFYMKLKPGKYRINILVPNAGTLINAVIFDIWGISNNRLMQFGGNAQNAINKNHYFDIPDDISENMAYFTIYIGDVPAILNKQFYVMLNYGETPYPYYPYYGDIVHSVEVPFYFTTKENVSPSSFLGGTWEFVGEIMSSQIEYFGVWKRSM